MRIAARFIYLALRPFGRHVSQFWDVVQAITASLATVFFAPGISVRLGLDWWPAGVVVGLVVLVLLFLFAGARLLSEKEARRRPAFRVECYSERIDSIWMWELMPVYQENQAVWLTIRNDGPTSRFAVSLLDIDGVPGSWKAGGRYDLIDPVWEKSSESSVEIVRSGEKRIRLANVSENPQAFWFWTSQSGNSLPGNKWHMDIDELPTHLTFKVSVNVLGEHDACFEADGKLTINPFPIDATVSVSSPVATDA